MTSPLITPAQLDELLRGDVPPVVLDVRWRLDAPDGRNAFRAGHVPSALYVSLDDELAAHGAPTDGRHPLPEPALFEQSARRWGIDDGDLVVVYDDWQSMAAARAWWMLVDAGVDARVLDGGIGAWRAAGLPLETGDAGADGRATDETGAATPGTATLRPGRMSRLDIDAAAALARDGVLLDARAGERYRGELEPIDPRAGHIPGALSAPTVGNVDADGRFLTPVQLRERFAALGVDDDRPVGAYCGSGVTAAHTVLALAVAGIDAALYPGSWSQWSNLPDRPVAQGATP